MTIFITKTNKQIGFNFEARLFYQQFSIAFIFFDSEMLASVFYEGGLGQLLNSLSISCCIGQSGIN